MYPSDKNITEWFRDMATRHTAIQHVEGDESKKRFFELEWDEMMTNAQALSNDVWYLILEDYREQFRDNGAEYVSITPLVSFWVLKAVDLGDAAQKMATYQEARRIALGIVKKMKKDTNDQISDCEADVPDGVIPPKLVDLSTLTVDRLAHPMFTHSFGVRVSVKLRTDHEEPFERDDADWLPLEG